MDISLIPSQLKFLEHKDDTEYAFLAGIGTGKSYIGAIWVFYRTYELGESIFVGSQTWSTTQGVQFKAITDFFDEVGLREGREYIFNKHTLEITYRGRPGRIKGCCSAAKKSIEGYTKFNGAWFDEASNWDEEVKNYVMGRCRGKVNGVIIEPRYRYTGTPPLEPTGWYYQWLSNNPGKYVQASTLEGVGHYLSQIYYDQQITAWGGKDSPLTAIMVHGQLPSQNSSTSIFRREHHAVEIPMSMGIDCSGGNGGDEAYFEITNGIFRAESFSMSDFTQKELLAKAIELADKHNVQQIRIDTTGGFGTYLCEALTDAGYNVEGINFGQSAIQRETYLNARAEMYVHCAEVWNDEWGDIYRPERYATSFVISNSGKMQLLAKEQIKKVIGHSPDGLDALVLALYTNIIPPIEVEPETISLSFKAFSRW